MTADYSRERRRAVLSLLRDKRFRRADLTPNARLMYAVSALACDETGHISEPNLSRAMADSSTVQAAKTLLRKAGY